jgi:DNA-binding CsgD family transcriptional regulator
MKTHAAGRGWGRPRLAVSPSELLAWWEGRRRPRSVREIARKLGISEGLVRHRLRELRAAGKVDDAARARAIAARGGPDRGGRPANPINDAALAAEWRIQRRIAGRKGTAPSLSAIARNLHISRSRALARLRALGLLGEDGSPSSCPPRHEIALNS